eukprot:TRINITY_DN30488_c0_g1_i1.p1 TRINITY_DN30488_c0_g1~~TRINITY_DN30488_c0_g1_i1.p1  ORF type:complete len:675 (+),score=207.14 TRINITY_DN30488_c0_g1_i1:67-2025(+)
MRGRTAALCALLGVSATVDAAGFYLPGVEQREYERGDAVGPIDVNSLTSIDGIIPYPFYSLKFCRPPRDMREERLAEEKLGEVLWGDHIEPSMYLLEMMTDMKCRPLACRPENRNMSRSDLKLFEARINAGYRGNLILDNLPVVSNMTWVMNRQCPSGKEIHDWQLRGFPLGVSASCLRSPEAKTGTCRIHNHLHFQVQVNQVKPDKFIVVGFYVVPQSIDHPDLLSCGESFIREANHPPVTTELYYGQTSKQIIWSYSVRWERKDGIFWASRWDAYLNSSFANTNARVHWLSIVNSLLIVLCLSAVVAMILMRTLHLDFNRYNNPENQDEAQEEVGWKLVHADVFRPPQYANLFCVTIGTGTQIVGMTCTCLFFALLGFLSPANRGGLLTTMLILFVLMGLANGFVTALLQKMFGMKEWKWLFAAGLMYPSVVFLSWALTEVFLASKKAANAVPLGTVVSVIGLWFGISLPLVLLGGAHAFRLDAIEPPVHVQRIERKIPPQRWYMNTWLLSVVPGFIPFMAAYVELGFILSSLWQGMVYYVFGFLSLVFFVVVLTAILTTIVAIYYQLVYEDYHWWWRSILVPGGMGIHFFLYSCYYYDSVLHVRTWLGTLIFFQFSVWVSVAVFLGMGTIGFFSGFLFVRSIYSAVKVE